MPLYTFFSVRRNRPACSRITCSSNRRGTHTLLDATRKSRTASAPCRSMTAQGSTAFPRLLDIFWPCASSTRSLTTTERYGAARVASDRRPADDTGASDGAPFDRRSPATARRSPTLFGSASPSPVAIASSE
jgi:hypothetical protein